MSNEVTTNFNMEPFLLDGAPLTKEDSVILQDAQRATPLVFGTLMAQVAASRKYVPFTDETAVDGTAIPCGIYIGPDITAAALVAGDVTNCNIAVRGDSLSVYDAAQLVIENSKTLNTVIGALSIHAKTVRQYLLELGISFSNTVEIDAYENT